MIQLYLFTEGDSLKLSNQQNTFTSVIHLCFPSVLHSCFQHRGNCSLFSNKYFSCCVRELRWGLFSVNTSLPVYQLLRSVCWLPPKVLMGGFIQICVNLPNKHTTHTFYIIAPLSWRKKGNRKLNVITPPLVGVLPASSWKVFTKNVKKKSMIASSCEKLKLLWTVWTYQFETSCDFLTLKHLVKI